MSPILANPFGVTCLVQFLQRFVTVEWYLVLPKRECQGCREVIGELEKKFMGNFILDVIDEVHVAV